MSTSTYHSEVEEIDNLRIHSIPSKPIKGASVIRVDRTYVIVDKAGKVYSSQVTGNYSYQPGYACGAMRNTLEGAYRLGAISKEAMDKDKATRDAIEFKREMKHQTSMLRIASHNLGIKLTAAQERRIAASQEQKGAAK